MGKYAYLNLTQKMIKIRKMVPKLLRKRYSEEETDEGFGMESEEEELERARKVMCNFGLFSGKTLGEMMENPKGADTVRWMATGYYGSNMEMVNAAKIIVAHEKQNRLAA